MSICYSAPEHLLPFYLAWQINPNSSNYHLNFAYQFPDRATVDLVLEKVQHLISLRPYLRQTFALQGETLIATVHEHYALSVEFHIATQLEFYQLEQELIAAPFDLETTPPLRINVVHLRDKNTYFLLFTAHHIIMDGITLDAFISELNALLAMRDLCGHGAEQYIEQNRAESVLEKVSSDQLVSEYMLQIENMAFSLDMPIMRSSSRVLHYTATLPSHLTDKMITYCTLKTISPFNLLLSTYALFLTKLTDQKQMLIRYPVNTRADKSMLGCFLNIVTFALQLDADWAYNHLVDHVCQKVVILKSMAKMHFQHRSHIANSIPSFSSLTVAALDPLVIREINYDARSYPQLGHGFISMKYRQKKNQFCFVCDILRDIYPEYFTDSILDRFFYFFEAVLDFPDTVLKKIDLVFPEEREKLLVEWNSTDVAYQKNKTLVDWFMESVRQFPDKIALKSREGTMTYAELNRRSENIASYLLVQGVQTEELVGILIDHRFEMITALFGVLKAGAAYVPIPHNAPAERIASIIKDSSVRFLLTASEWLHLVCAQVKKIDIAEIQLEYRQYCQPYIHSRQLAYVIYTSGTTGIPKGIAIEQRSIVNYVNFLIRVNCITDKTIGSKCAGFGFDASVIEIYPILFSGGMLCIIEDENRLDCGAICDFFEKNKITYAFLTTPLAMQFINIECTVLKNLVVGGESLRHCKLQTYEILNAYGPTEGTVQSTYFMVSESQYTHIPIGRSIDNMKCYVVDRDLNLMPIGVIGELCISGIGLARGYLNNSELNSEKFLDNPFCISGSASQDFFRLYKTGDLVRWSEDGNIEFFGRRDLQVKLGGCRIELEEIECILSGHSDIDQTAIVLLDKNGQNCLVAYYTLKKDVMKNDLHDSIFLAFMASFLPEYMLPSIFVRLDTFPLNINGKIDRARIPSPDLNMLMHYVPPKNYMQRIVCDAYMDILALPEVGINSDFFRLGGNSIKAISLVAKLQHNFVVTVMDIFMYSTPERLANKIRWLPDNIWKKLAQLKIQYPINHLETILYDIDECRKISEYGATINAINRQFILKSYRNVLLTGSTGYLGCNILNQLLTLTDYNLILLVRAPDLKIALMRLQERYFFYFDVGLTAIDLCRITIVVADLERDQLNLGSFLYGRLASEVDSIIHAAGLVKHYASVSDFISANVEATRNLLDFCKISRGRNFHYISTISVLTENNGSGIRIFTEDDDSRILLRTPPDNVYIRSKLEGEALVLAYREQGIYGAIYRVGNLAFMASNGKLQYNCEDNAFYNQVRTLLRWRVVSGELGCSQISPVDSTAKALVLLFDKEIVENQTFHVFDPYYYNISDILLDLSSVNMKAISFSDFVDVIIEHLNCPITCKDAERFLLHQNWLNRSSALFKRSLILQNRSQEVLRVLHFLWTPISMSTFKSYVDAICTLL